MSRLIVSYALVCMSVVSIEHCMAQDDIRLMGSHNNTAPSFGGRRIIPFAASFNGPHDYGAYKRAFEDVRESTNQDKCAQYNLHNTNPRHGNQSFQLDGRKAILGWYDNGDPDSFYWYGVHVDSKTHSEFIDCYRNRRNSHGFYGSGMSPNGCRTDYVGARIFSQFADNDNYGIVWRFDIDERDTLKNLTLSSPLDDIQAELNILKLDLRRTHEEQEKKVQ